MTEGKVRVSPCHEGPAVRPSAIGSSGVTSPGRGGIMRCPECVFHLARHRRMQPQAMDTPLVRIEHFELPARRVIHALADVRHMPRQHRRKAAQRIDVALGFAKPRIDQLGRIFQFSAGIRVPRAAVDRHQ
ncbi:hypothetical protein WR25_14120 [Diploscapter pachys]|uniref:Uncharacterized protein n=1 Tax=Diploscapter pachys TaxID=2018661 RepID=A0A2A2KLF8_9BILA|nr:hypothetical protein WR25_14120 [Diploscapter pachys]